MSKVWNVRDASDRSLGNAKSAHLTYLAQRQQIYNNNLLSPDNYFNYRISQTYYKGAYKVPSSIFASHYIK
jgi:hypothetical protein